MSSLLTSAVISELREIVGEKSLITAPAQLQTYECDGLTAFRTPPLAVLLPESTVSEFHLLRAALEPGCPAALFLRKAPS
jgi:glycolate oxidase